MPERSAIRFTAHAEEMIEERGIESAWVVETLTDPEHSEPDPRDPTLTRCYRRIADAGGRTLRVVHRPTSSGILVITAHFDRGASR